MIIYCPKCINPSGQGTISISGYPMYCEKHIGKTLPTITRIQNNLVDEATLREQIAREIMAKCKNEKETNRSEFGSYEVSGCLEFIQLEDTAYYEVTCTHAEDAAIAGGDKE